MSDTLVKGGTDLLSYATSRADAALASLREGKFSDPALLALRSRAYPLEEGVSLAYDGVHGLAKDCVDENAATVKFCVSSPRVDRMGDVVVPKGCLETLETFRANPVAFFSHKSREMPIGSWCDPQSKELWLEVGEDKIFGKLHFHLKTRESEEVFALVAAGHLRATSIGFRPLHGWVLEDKEGEDDDAPRPKKNEIAFKPWLPIKFDGWELLEISVVPVPANPDALCGLRGAYSKGLSPRLQDVLAPVVGRKDSEALTLPVYLLDRVKAVGNEEEEKNIILPPEVNREVVETVVKALEALTPPQEVPVGKDDLGPGATSDPAAVPPGEAEPNLVPAGALALDCFLDCYRCHAQKASEHLKVVEQARVKSFLRKQVRLCEKMLTRTQALAHEVYPDLFEAPPEPPSEESPKDIAPAVVKSPPPPTPPAGPSPEELRAIEAVKAARQELEESYYRLTGKRLGRG